MLSAKLYEDRLVLIESEAIEYSKTKFLNMLLQPYMSDKLTFLTSFNPDENFLRASSNLQNISVKTP